MPTRDRCIDLPVAHPSLGPDHCMTSGSDRDALLSRAYFSTCATSAGAPVRILLVTPSVAWLPSSHVLCLCICKSIVHRLYPVPEDFHPSLPLES